MKKPKRKPCQPLTYSVFMVMLADPVKPMPEVKQHSQLDRMHKALTEIEWGASPEIESWRVCSDITNLLETLILHGKVSDADGAIMEGVRAMAEAGKRRKAGGQIRLDADGVDVMWSLLNTYIIALENLSERVIVQAHRDTEIRIRAILVGKRQAHDVEIVDI
jgi:hypothetical protein